MKRWLLSGKPASILAVLSALIAVGQWLILLVVAAMTVDAGELTRALLLLAFFAWPVAAVTAVAAAVLVRRRPPASGWPPAARGERLGLPRPHRRRRCRSASRAA